MKKQFLVFLLLLAVFISIPLTSFADKTEVPEKFDYSVFEDLAGYEYDKFEDTWLYFRAYLKKYSDANVIIGIQIEGDEDGIAYAPDLYVRVTSPTSSEPLYAVKSIDFLIDDTKYSYKTMWDSGAESMVILGQRGKLLVEALSQCENVSVKLTFEYSSISFDLEQEELESTIKAISQQLISHHVWDYIDDSTVVLFEDMYPLTIK